MCEYISRRALKKRIFRGCVNVYPEGDLWTVIPYGDHGGYTDTLGDLQIPKNGNRRGEGRGRVLPPDVEIKVGRFGNKLRRC